MVFLDSLKENEITESLKYFSSYWEYFCYILKNPDVYTYKISPHYIIQEIINEIKTNGIRNAENFKLFANQIQCFLNKKELFSEETYSLWIILHEKIISPDKDRNILLHMTESILDKFDSQDYKTLLFNNLYAELRLTTANKDTIKALAGTLIFELLFSGFSLSYIEKLIRDIFSGYSIQIIGSENHFITSYPLKYKSDSNNNEEYIKNASEEMDNLDLSARMNRLLEIIHSPKQEYYFIFYIEGLNFDDKLSFEDIVFYSPNKETMVIDSFDPKNDVFEGANYETGMNVIVLEKCVDTEIGKRNALKRIAQICDVFRLFENSKSNFFINDTYYKILDHNKKMYKGTVGYSNEIVTKFDVIKNKENLEYVKEFSTFLFVNNSIIKSDKEILIDSLHYYRKAFECKRPEDKLLNLWITLERLFLGLNILSEKSKFERINILVRSFLFERFVFQKGWRTYNTINRLLQSKTMHNGVFIPEIDFSKKTQLKANIGEYLQYPTEIELSKFVNEIPEIITEINNGFYIDMLKDTYDFYNNHEISKREIEEILKTLRNELLMIYRQRNQIVHNASFDEIFIDFHINQLKSIVTIIFYDLFKIMNTGKNLEKSVLDIYLHSEQNIYLATKDKEYTFITQL